MTYINLVIVTSILLAIYGLQFFVRASIELLAKHRIRLKFMVLQFVLLFSNLQTAIFESVLAKFGVPACKGRWGTTVRASSKLFSLTRPWIRPLSILWVKVMTGQTDDFHIYAKTWLSYCTWPAVKSVVLLVLILYVFIEKYTTCMFAVIHHMMLVFEMLVLGVLARLVYRKSEFRNVSQLDVTVHIRANGTEVCMVYV